MLRDRSERLGKTSQQMGEHNQGFGVPLFPKAQSLLFLSHHCVLRVDGK